MDEGLIQILFFVAIIVFSIMDAIARKKKKEREMGEMDLPGEREQEERGSLHRREPEPWQVESERDGEDVRDERGADSMIPADLWEEITGMKRPPPPSAPAPDRSGGREGAASRPDSPAPGQRFPAPAPSPVPAPSPEPRRWDTPQPTAAAGRGTARSSAPRSSDARRDDFPERMRTTELGALAEEIREKGRRELSEIEIAAGVEEVEDGVHPRAGARKFPGAKRRRRATGVASTLAASLRGDAQALQKAVLYREVLGRPLGSRPGAGGWEEPVG
jgi:hypothetical protein